MKKLYYIFILILTLVNLPTWGMKRPAEGMPEGEAEAKKARVEAELSPLPVIEVPAIKIIDKNTGEDVLIEARLFPMSQALRAMRERGQLVVDYSYQLFPLLEDTLQALYIYTLMAMPDNELVKSYNELLANPKFKPIVDNPDLLVQTIYMFDYLTIPPLMIEPLIHQYAWLLTRPKAKPVEAAGLSAEESMGLPEIVEPEEQETKEITELPGNYNGLLAKYYFLFSGEHLEGIKSPGVSIADLLAYGRISLNQNITLVQNPQGILYDVNLSNLTLNSVDELEDWFAQIRLDQTNIRSLILSRNQLTQLPDNFLDNCRNLQQLSLFQNQLTQLPANFLDNCTALQRLSLAQNQLMQLPDNFLDNCRNLQQLMIFQNQLTQLPANFLDNCTALQQLSLAQNQLMQLPDNFLDNCRNLQQLMIFKNQLTQLPVNFLDNCRVLRTLNLFQNQLTQLPDDFLNNCTALQQLAIAYNQLAQLPVNFLDNCRVLRTLNLSQNQLAQLPDDFLNNCTALQKLAIAHNQLTQLPANFLNNCVALTNIRLDNNQLMQLPDNFLSTSKKLNGLTLYANKLTRLPAKFLQHNILLKELYLQDNPLPQGVIKQLWQQTPLTQRAMQTGEAKYPIYLQKDAQLQTQAGQ